MFTASFKRMESCLNMRHFTWRFRMRFKNELFLWEMFWLLWKAVLEAIKCQRPPPSKPFSHPLHTQLPSMMHELSVNLHKAPYLASVDNPPTPAASQRQPCAKSDASLYFWVWRLTETKHSSKPGWRPPEGGANTGLGVMSLYGVIKCWFTRFLHRGAHFRTDFSHFCEVHWQDRGTVGKHCL